MFFRRCRRQHAPNHVPIILKTWILLPRRASSWYGYSRSRPSFQSYCSFVRLAHLQLGAINIQMQLGKLKYLRILEIHDFDEEPHDMTETFRVVDQLTVEKWSETCPSLTSIVLRASTSSRSCSLGHLTATAQMVSTGSAQARNGRQHRVSPSARISRRD